MRISWKNVKPENITAEQANEYLDNNNLVYVMNGEIPVSNGSRYYDSFHLKEAKSKTNIYTVDNKFVPHIFTIRNTNNTLTNDLNGKEAFEEVKTLFSYLNNSVSFDAAFGKDLKHHIKSPEYAKTSYNAVSSPLNYGAKQLKPYYSVYKIDVCSAYAAEASKKLPTIDNCRLENGYVEPDINYPFAFYISDQNGSYIRASIFGEDVKTDLSKQLIKRTILCKDSGYSLAAVMQHYFKQKENAKDAAEKQKNKNFMNFFVGYCQLNYSPIYAHISATVIARCNARMNSMCNYIEEKGGKVILINTDAIAWTGIDYPELYQTKKELGAFILEYANCTAYVKGAKSYQLLEPNGKVHTVWAGVLKEKTEQLEFGGIWRKDIAPTIWVFDKKTKRFIQREFMEV